MPSEHAAPGPYFVPTVARRCPGMKGVLRSIQTVPLAPDHASDGHTTTAGNLIALQGQTLSLCADYCNQSFRFLECLRPLVGGIAVPGKETDESDTGCQMSSK